MIFMIDCNKAFKIVKLEKKFYQTLNVLRIFYFFEAYFQKKSK